MKHAVYFNLHKHRLSLRDEQTKKVIGHCEAAWFKDAEFKVSEAGRQRVIREKRKNVHAVVRGTLLQAGTIHNFPLKDYIFVSYNPYKFNSFIEYTTNKPIKSAKSVIVIGKKIFAKDITYDI
jgi:hypothetical protein